MGLIYWNILIVSKEYPRIYMYSSGKTYEKCTCVLYDAMPIFPTPSNIQGVLSGVFRGSGRQLLAASVNFVVYYVIGLPLGICLALLAHLDTLGMWSGLAFANGLQVRFLVTWLFVNVTPAII